MKRRFWDPAVDVDAVWDRNPSARDAWAVYTLLAFAIGMSLLLGAPERTSAAAFLLFHQTGGALVWGPLFLGGATALTAARSLSLTAMRWAHWAGAATLLLWGISFFQSSVHSPAASLLGAPAFTAVACLMASRALDYRRVS